MAKRSRCSSHCSSCNLHFTSDAAFDAHRVGDYAAPIGSETGRRCLHPIEVLDRDGESRFLALTTTGRCVEAARTLHAVDSAPGLIEQAETRRLGEAA